MWGPVMGLDIGASAVKLCQIKGKGQQLVLSRLGLSSLPVGVVTEGEIIDSHAVIDAIRAASRAAGSRQKKVALALSHPTSVLIRRIAVPIMTEAELQEQIRWEAEAHIPFDVDDVHLDYSLLTRREDQGVMDVLLVAARKDRVAMLTEVVRKAGLKPMGCDAAVNVLGRLYLACCVGGVHPELTEALVDVGQSQTEVSVIDGGTMLGSRVLSVGSESITELIQKRVGVGRDEAEALLRSSTMEAATAPYRGASPEHMVLRCIEEGAKTISDEVSRVLDFLVSTTPLEALSGLVVTGGPAARVELAQALQHVARARVSLWNPLTGIAVHPRVSREIDLERWQLRLGQAVGLALAEQTAQAFSRR